LCSALGSRMDWVFFFFILIQKRPSHGPKFGHLMLRGAAAFRPLRDPFLCVPLCHWPSALLPFTLYVCSSSPCRF
jgi:hypothetical protein